MKVSCYQTVYSFRMITVLAVDRDGIQGPVSTVTITFDRSCLILPNTAATHLTLATQDDVNKLSVCTSLRNTRIDIIGPNIESLQPMREITVSHIHRLTLC